MTRYSRPADTLNPALDLTDRQAFELDLGDGNGRCSYPRNWFQHSTPEEIAARGFTGYELAAPPPPDPTPEDTPLTLAQLHLVLFKPTGKGGLGFTKQEISTFLRNLPDDGSREEAEIRLEKAASFHWDHAFIQAMVPFIKVAKGMSDEQVRAAWMQASVL